MADVKRLRSKFRCIDLDEVSLYGDYDSSDAQTLVVALEIDENSNPATDLKDKYLVYLANEKLLNKLADDPGLKESKVSKLYWERVPTVGSYTYYNQFHLSKLSH